MVVIKEWKSFFHSTLELSLALELSLVSTKSRFEKSQKSLLVVLGWSILLYISKWVIFTISLNSTNCHLGQCNGVGPNPFAILACTSRISYIGTTKRLSNFESLCTVYVGPI